MVVDVNRIRHWTNLIIISLIVISSKGVLTQNCNEPTPPHGNFVGSTDEGGIAAVLCHNGYNGGGAATCAGGVWTLPDCVPEDCGTPTVAKGVFEGDTFYEGSAKITCQEGYTGSGASFVITCLDTGVWENLPSCDAVDCLDPGIPNGNNVGDTIFGGGAFILCRTGYTGGGALTCLANGDWDSKPTCAPRDCGDVQVTNGDLTGEFFYEGTARVECDPGYEGSGPATCQSDGAWATLPTCTAVDCQHQDIQNGQLTGPTTFGGSAFVQCDPGYNGDAAATCTAAGTWATPLPTCSPKDCGEPDVTHGHYVGSTLYGGTASTQCDNGYEGDASITCTTAGTWGPIPDCTPKNCPNQPITNGQLAGDLFFEGTSSVKCDTGYEGDATATCLASGDWAPLPTCTPVYCDELSVTNGNLQGDRFYTGTATVVCNTGYDGTGPATCSSAGAWENVPSCTPKDCGEPAPAVANGNFYGDTVYDGTANVTCSPGYDGNGPAICGSDGNWATVPTCTPKDCGDPGITHSTNLGDTLFNGGAFFACDTGYVGGGAAECLDTGSWGPLPTCDPIDCQQPTIPHGSLTNTSVTVYDGSATVKCDVGYEIKSGNGAATCLSNGDWDTLPTCIPVDCGQPSIPNGFLTGDSETFYTGNATVDCDPGYEGGGTATCLDTGDWDTPPTCEPKDCGDLSNPVHGSVSYTTTTYTSTASYACESLWILNGSSILVCGTDGNWTPDPPFCDDIDCEALTAPQNGFLSTIVVKVGTVVTVTCDGGYSLFGDVNLECVTGGTWDTTVGTCRKDCPALTAPVFGAISTQDVREGTIVSTSCNTNYTLEGFAQTVCQPGGFWNNMMPVCTENCPALSAPAHGSINTDAQSQGTVVFVFCDTGYTLFGADTLICLTTALWNNAVPDCRLDCPVLVAPQNGNLGTTIRSQGTQVGFSCSAGYTLFGEPTLTCRTNSTWDYDIPVCKQNCPALTVPSNGVTDSTEVHQTTVISFFCNTGYTLFGAASLTCQSDATWNDVEPDCRQNCRALVDPTNGAKDSVAVMQTTEVLFNCVTGYTLFGSAVLICQSDATWNSTEPVCREDCPPLTPPANGSIDTQILSQGIEVGISCDTTYTLFGPGILTCQSDATWDNPLPVCKKDCPILTAPAHGSFNTSLESQGTVLGVSCDTNYTLFGDSILFCQTDSTWDTVLPVCLKNCPAIITPTNGFIDDTNVSQETIVSFSCEGGYTLFGTGAVVCQSDASWNSTEPTCEKDCPELTIGNGSVSTTTVIYTTVVTITCNANFSLEGESVLTCVSNGLWNYDIPRCTKDCRPLVPPTNGEMDSTAVSQDSQITFECDKGFTLFGADVLTCLDSATWDYQEPTCRPDCPNLHKPTHSIFSTTGVYEGVVVIVSCQTGFTLFGNENITCLPGGVWDKSLPTCRRDCSSLVVPENGALDTEDVMEGTVVTVTCNTGYTLLGVAVLNCLPGGKWDSFLPVCHRECGPLSTPPNGRVDFSDGTTLGRVAAYACYTGYDLSHTFGRTCQSDGTWSYTEPTCVIRDCGFIPVPTNGAISYSNAVTTYLEIATFTCHAGYYRTGADKRKCMSDKTWGGMSPVCVIKDCGALENPQFGTVSTAGGTTFGEVAVYYCNVGYSLIGNNERNCEADGLWSGTIPVCEIKDCGVLTNPSNGNVSFLLTTYNEVAYYTCHAGYTLSGVSSRICRQDAAWSSSAPSCQIKAATTENIPSNICAQRRITSACAVAYSDQNLLWAHFGKPGMQSFFMRTTKTLIRQRLLMSEDCGTLAPPSKGSVFYSNGATTYEEIATFDCVTGYALVGDETRTCMADGRWGGTTPNCVIKDCGPLAHPEFGTVNTASGTKYNKIANYFCNTGYVLDGVSVRTCQADGQWSNIPPVCRIRECPSLSNTSNGFVSDPFISYNSIATYVCDAGYNLVGVSQRVCQQDGTWSDSAPVCEIKDCGTPHPIRHGKVAIPSGTTFNASAIYSCNVNYGLLGIDAVPCLPSGFWALPPVCNRDCGQPTAIVNGEYLIQTDTLTGSVATYSCVPGYLLVGEADVTCRNNGQWESPPTCQIISEAYNNTCYVTEQCNTERATCRSDGLGFTRCLCAGTGEVYNSDSDICLAYCGFQTAPTNGYIVHPLEPSEGQVITYSCDLGFALSDVSLATRTCLATGYWSETAPLCIVGCPDPPNPTNGIVDMSQGTAIGKKITYRCNSGYTLVGDSFRECLADTSWHGNEPVCAIECPVLIPIQYGKIDLSSGHWEDSIVTYYCDKDYAMIGTATRKCQATGKWTGTDPECIYAIFSDILLVIGSLLMFLVIVDIFIVIILIYMRRKRKTDDGDNSEKYDCDHIEETMDDNKHLMKEVTPVERVETSIPPMRHVELGPPRASFKKPRDVKIESETEPPKIPHIPKNLTHLKREKSDFDVIPRPKPIQKGLRVLRRSKRGKARGPEQHHLKKEKLGFNHSTPRFKNADEFKDDTIADLENLLKDDTILTPGSSDHNRRSTADEEKVSIDPINSSRMEAGDKMVLMDCDDEIPSVKPNIAPMSIKGGLSVPTVPNEVGPDSSHRRNPAMHRSEPLSPFSVQHQSEV